MRKTVVTSIIIGLVAAPVSISTQTASAAEMEANKPLGTLVDAATLDAASASATVSPESSLGFGLLLLHITVDEDSGNDITAISMTCASSIGGYNYALQSCTTIDGEATCYEATWTHDPSGTSNPKRWLWRVDIEGLRGVTCTFTDIGGIAADTITVVGTLATKG